MADDFSRLFAGPKKHTQAVSQILARRMNPEMSDFSSALSQTAISGLSNQQFTPVYASDVAAGKADEMAKVYDQFTTAAKNGHAESAALLESVQKAAGDDPADQMAVLKALNDDPDEIDLTNMGLKAVRAANALGITAKTSQLYQTKQQLELDKTRAEIDKAKQFARIGGGGLPAAVETYEYFKGLDPQGQSELLALLGRNKVIDVGGSFVQVNPATRQVVATFDKDLTPQQQRDANIESSKSVRLIEGTQERTKNTMQVLNEAESLVTPFTTAFGAKAFDQIPGFDALRLRALNDTIKANIGFDRLNEMRQESPTGGALGQVAVQELDFLQNTIAPLSTAQSPSQYLSSLRAVKNHLAGQEKRLLDAYRRDVESGLISGPYILNKYFGGEAGGQAGGMGGGSNATSGFGENNNDPLGLGLAR